jgi:beta-glucosidase
VRRILRTALRFGWLDRDQTALSIPRYNLQGRQVALNAARGGITLLKNDGGLLPPSKSKIQSVLIIIAIWPTRPISLLLRLVGNPD